MRRCSVPPVRRSDRYAPGMTPAPLPSKSAVEAVYLRSISAQRDQPVGRSADLERACQVLEIHTAAWRHAFGEMHRGDEGWPSGEEEAAVLHHEASLLRATLKSSGVEPRRMALLMNSAMLARHTTVTWRRNTPLTNIAGVRLRESAHPLLTSLHDPGPEPAAQEPPPPPPRAPGPPDEGADLANGPALRDYSALGGGFVPMARTSGEFIPASWSLFRSTSLRSTIGYWVACYSPDLMTLAFDGDDGTFRELSVGDVSSVRTVASGINRAIEVVAVDGGVFVAVGPRNRILDVFSKLGVEVP